MRPIVSLKFSFVRWLVKTLLVLFVFFPTKLVAQSLDFSNIVPSELTVCAEADTFRVSYTNNTLTAISGQEISVELPTGIQYVMSSLINKSGHNVQESNVLDNTGLLFTANNLPVGETLSFCIATEARMEAISYQLDGNIFRNNVIVNHNGGSEENLSSAYNILYAALSITNISPTSQSVNSGDSFTRSITIANAGYGKLNEFQLTDTHEAGVELIDVNIGTINATADVVNFSATDFTTIGNGDAYFDLGETIVLTETFIASGCVEQTISSTITNKWGCDVLEETSSNSYAHASISLKTPNISSAANSNLESCFGSDEASQQEIILTNGGQGIAKQLQLDIYKSTGGDYNEDIFSRIDLSSITYKFGLSGTPVNIAPSASYTTRNDGDYSCLGSNPIGRVVLDLPDLAAGEIIVVNWDTYHCCINVCNGDKNQGWKYQYDYEDACAENSYSSTKTGENTNNDVMSLFTESPSDITDGESKEYTFIVSSLTNDQPQGEGAHYEFVFDLPAGLVWDGATEDLSFHSGPNEWTAMSIDYDNGSNTLIAKYALPAPFQIPKSELDINLRADCNQANAVQGEVSVALAVNYIADTTCSSTCSIPMVCGTSLTSDLHCPTPGPCEGMKFYGFDWLRSNYGSPDNDQNGLADASGNIDFDGIKRNRAMVGDTLRATYKGLVGTGATFSEWTYGYASSYIEQGSNLTQIDASVEIYDASAAAYIVCEGVGVNASISGTSQTFVYDFSATTLAASCPELSGFTFNEGDSVFVHADYEVTGNIGGAVQEIKSTNSYYMSDIPNPSLMSNKYQCDFYNGKITLIGYYFNVSWNTNYTVNNCSKVVQQNFWMSIGDCCSNYAGGNLFPYEYRNWAYVKDAYAVIPDNYIVLDSYFRNRRTRYTNSYSTQTVNNISAASVSGDTLFYNLEQYQEGFGGDVKLSDDGFHGTLYIELAPSCDVPINTFEDVDWGFNFQKAAILGGEETGWIEGNPDRIRYSPTELQLSSANPTIDGLEKTVTWDLKVKNSTGNTDASNCWIHIKNPSGDMIIEELRDGTGALVDLDGDIYRIGSVNRNQSQNFTITASYSACVPDYITVYSGYECSSYPENFEDFNCSYTTMGLFVEPKPAAMQVKLDGTTIGTECSNEVQVELEIASVKLALVDSIKVNVTAVGNSMSFLSGTAALKYPLGDDYITVSDPAVGSNTFQFDLASLNATLAESGLPGVLDLENNRLRLRFHMNMENDFAPGDYVQFSVEGQEVCGNSVPTINLAYDPSIRFDENTSAGLTEDSGDSWGLAWGDYDNDGFEDVYIADYGTSSTSFLYHNNGDGSFSKITTGVVASDTGGAVSGVWGDYDNDGDLDLFVSNNLASKNQLYTNNGDGTFAKKDNSAVNEYAGYCHNAEWIDYDNDGFLDLYVTDYMPTRFNQLYHNNGDGTFAATTGNPVVMEATYSIGSGWADYDNDGDLDLFVPNTQGNNNSFYTNDGNGDFSQITTGALVNDGGNSVGCSWGDYDNDGDLDLFVANSSEQNNFFYINNGDGTFTKETESIVANDGGHTHGSSWVDYDNDGDLDLYVSNDQENANALYVNDGGFFSKFDNPLNENMGNSYANAWADFDNDGDLDLLVANHSNENNKFFVNNRGNCNRWACVKLTGTQSNRNGIGAKVFVKANVYGEAIWQMREISTQSGGGAGAQSTMRAMFGFGDATTIDSVKVVWPSGFVQYLTNEPTNGCIEITEETGMLVCGTIYYDANGNCEQDAEELGISGATLSISPGQRYVTSDEDGYYQIYLDEGDYTLEQQSMDGWALTCPNGSQSYELTLTTGNTYCNNDFGNEAICNDPNLEVDVATTALRRGFRNTLVISYQNNGVSEANNTSLELILDNEIVAISASTEWDNAIVGAERTTYTWNQGTLAALEEGVIELVDSVSVAAELGINANITAAINFAGTDCDASDNSRLLVDEIVGSVDPNDILVSPKGYGETGMIDQDQRLTYKIRFQNVGNYYASRVVITDELSKFLDLSTLEIEGYSHDFDYELNGRELMFKTEGIYLPDSTANEAGSHGFIKYSIMPRQGMFHGFTIYNKASIQFDYNDYIETNTVVNTISRSLYLAKNGLIKIHFSANPMTNETYVSLKAIDGSDVTTKLDRVEVYNIAGRIVKELEGANTIDVRIGRDRLQPGFYLVRVYDEFGMSYSERLIVK